ncbi:hypothetical protein K493DRAFT_321075 [Basidiobolus meristosporus CBS 931.73]|uniref:Uncharacterized protein n=1 Tax=Basidiobolus meristosporus CBS 931.73 TaxID=1314790 RepID=A0A1Y1X0S9_9FUNG|nr:hypothetical protein K493DRAFT_321075 [Basidiobolus meristosporus CBS 931.73]|eukprot:ORX79275.1 hypothetical protein K493DRAFT_321075 [Basidiobolus meristosporus CBS 931.73]
MDASPSSPKETHNLDQLKELVLKRISTFAYLQRVQNGQAHYFNTILLTAEDLAHFFDNTRLRRRSYNLFILGTSLGPILDITNTSDYIKALNSMTVEYEHYVNEGGKSRKRNFFRKSKPGEGFSANLQDGEYRYLDIPTTPFELDYLEVLNTLCDIFVVTYNKLMENIQDIGRDSLSELVMKIDAKFKKIAAMMCKDLDVLIHNAIKDELFMIDPLRMSKHGPDAAEEWDTLNALHI